MSPLINRMFLDFPRAQDALLWWSFPVLSPDTLLSQCLSPSRCINGTSEFNAGVTLRRTSISSKGSTTILAASCYRNRDKLRPDRPLDSYTDFTLQSCVLQTDRVTGLILSNAAWQDVLQRSSLLVFSTQCHALSLRSIPPVGPVLCLLLRLTPTERSLRPFFSSSFSPGYFESSQLFDNHHTICFSRILTNKGVNGCGDITPICVSEDIEFYCADRTLACALPSCSRAGQSPIASFCCKLMR